MKQLFSLNQYFLKYKWLFLFGILFVILSNYFRILAPQITGYIVNNIVQEINPLSTAKNHHSLHNNYNATVKFITHSFDQLTFKKKILFAGLLLLLFAIISGFFMFLMRQTIIVMSRHIEFDQKNTIYAHYQQLDLAFYKEHSTGDLMNRISDDVSKVRMYTGPALMYFINLAAVIGFSIYFMLISDVKLTLVALCPLPILAITIYYVNKIINRKSERIQSLLSELTSDAQESYAGIRVTKSFAQEPSMIKYYDQKSEEYRSHSLSLAKTEAAYFPSMAFIIGISTLITILVGGLDVIHGVNGASIGKITEFILYIQLLTFPVSAIGWTASMIQRAETSQRRINEFLNISPSIFNAINTTDKNISGNIKIENGNFTYKNTGINAINNFSLEIKKGEKIAVIGKIGSGKTTLAQLLLRMYDLDSGTISFDGVQIKDLSLFELRKSISYVPQDGFLFSDTIKANISFGNENATLQEIENAAKNAAVYNEIMNLPAKFDTIIGERGVTLSGGQKQRIAIARALLKNPAILIFDDCLSAVDSKTESMISENMQKNLHDKTSIFITHRTFSALKFDKIIVLDQGKIVEMGSHEDLISKKGYYFDIYNKQKASEQTKG
jgi:ATP-binding cassette subfamily B protein